MRASARRQRRIPVGADAAWRVVRRPELLHLWFPGITACTVEGDQRTITLGTGIPLVATSDPSRTPGGVRAVLV